MRRLLLVITCVLLIGSMWIALTKGRIQGPPADPGSPVRNVIYAHVPSSICSLLCFGVLLVAAVGYLYTNKDSWDRLGASAAEVGVIFATVLNLTGSIFSRAEWGPWWTPTPRLVTAAILWLLYIVYLILRTSLPGSRQRRARICAVFAIIAFLDVPMVIISARLMPDIHRASFGFTSPWQRVAFFAAMIGTSLLALLMIWLRTDILNCRAQLEEQD
jgi:heme exporter protein C